MPFTGRYDTELCTDARWWFTYILDPQRWHIFIYCLLHKLTFFSFKDVWCVANVQICLFTDAKLWLFFKIQCFTLVLYLMFLKVGKNKAYNLYFHLHLVWKNSGVSSSTGVSNVLCTIRQWHWSYNVRYCSGDHNLRSCENSPLLCLCWKSKYRGFYFYFYFVLKENIHFRHKKSRISSV